MPPGSSCHSPPQLRSAAASSRSAQAYASFPSPSSAPSCTVSLIRAGVERGGDVSPRRGVLWPIFTPALIIVLGDINSTYAFAPEVIGDRSHFELRLIVKFGSRVRPLAQSKR